MPPNIENGTVGRKPYVDCRPREYLTGQEVTELMNVARKRGRYGQRDATMILLAYRHGFRSSELCALRWDQINEFPDAYSKFSTVIDENAIARAAPHLLSSTAADLNCHGSV